MNYPIFALLFLILATSSFSEAIAIGSFPIVIAKGGNPNNESLEEARDYEKKHKLKNKLKKKKKKKRIKI